VWQVRRERPTATWQCGDRRPADPQPNMPTTHLVQKWANNFRLDWKFVFREIRSQKTPIVLAAQRSSQAISLSSRPRMAASWNTCRSLRLSRKALANASIPDSSRFLGEKANSDSDS
jgi:hypothetical protein